MFRFVIFISFPYSQQGILLWQYPLCFHIVNHMITWSYAFCFEVLLIVTLKHIYMTWRPMTWDELNRFTAVTVGCLPTSRWHLTFPPGHGPLHTKLHKHRGLTLCNAKYWYIGTTLNQHNDYIFRLIARRAFIQAPTFLV